VPKDGILFRQGEKSHSLYLVIEGTFSLNYVTLNIQRRVGTVGPGEVLGEKAMVDDAPYKHAHPAIAMTDATVLEIEGQSLKLIPQSIPEFHRKLLRNVTKRLDEATELISILQSRDSVERLVQYLIFFCHHHHKKSPHGLEISLTIAELQDAVNVDGKVAENCLSAMVDEKILIQKEQGFLIGDENALLSYLPSLKEKLAA
jgi:CRP-like cAMP-binding protein